MQLRIIVQRVFLKCEEYCRVTNEISFRFKTVHSLGWWLTVLWNGMEVGTAEGKLDLNKTKDLLVIGSYHLEEYGKTQWKYPERNSWDMEFVSQDYYNLCPAEHNTIDNLQVPISCPHCYLPRASYTLTDTAHFSSALPLLKTFLRCSTLFILGKPCHYSEQVKTADSRGFCHWTSLAWACSWPGNICFLEAGCHVKHIWQHCRARCWDENPQHKGRLQRMDVLRTFIGVPRRRPCRHRGDRRQWAGGHRHIHEETTLASGFLSPTASLQIHVGLTEPHKVLMCSRIPPYKLVSILYHWCKPVTLDCFVTWQLIT